jgi:AraC family transcriptional regulator, regulatory protein of adaptative response / methylated-DNA-[protein]-cysteine methyltransferase
LKATDELTQDPESQFPPKAGQASTNENIISTSLSDDPAGKNAALIVPALREILCRRTPTLQRKNPIARRTATCYTPLMKADSGVDSMEEIEYWEAVCSRNRAFDGVFVYAVRSTGIFCRPSCPSRRPRREHVQFFDSSAEAERAGFRACRRCQPEKRTSDEPNLALVQRICRYLTESRDEIPTLAELAQEFHLSPYHLQRTFKRIVGVTPRQYAEAQRLERFKAGLRQGDSVTDALYEAGYPSNSSAYTQAARQFGMSPTAYKRGGATDITYALTESPLGWLLVAGTTKGLCAVRLGDSPAALEAELASEFPAAGVTRDDMGLGAPVTALMSYLHGAQPHLDLPLDIRATAFQQQVWRALQAIPVGSTRSYGEVAAAIGRPTAARAVARACASNPVALVIPCHRVIREDGNLGGYRWGLERKERLLAQETSAAVKEAGRAGEAAR